MIRPFPFAPPPRVTCVIAGLSHAASGFITSGFMLVPSVLGAATPARSASVACRSTSSTVRGETAPFAPPGAAMISGGAALYLLAPKAPKADREKPQQALYLAPAVSPDGAGIVFGGRM